MGKREDMKQSQIILYIRRASFLEYELEKGKMEDIVAERLLAEIVFLGAQFLNYSGTCIYIVSTQLLTTGD